MPLEFDFRRGSMREKDDRKHSMRHWLLLYAVLLLIPLLVLFGLSRQYLYRPLQTLPIDRIFEIEAGTPLSRLSQDLREQGIVRYPLLFNALARLQGVEQAIRQGEYQLPAGATPAELLALFVAGETRQFRLTLIEGWTFDQALRVIQSSEGISPVLRDTPAGDIARAMNLEVADPEGMIFPDTYFYSAGATDLQILLRANARLLEILGREWSLRNVELPLESPYEALILASIVEKEAASRDQRGLIAGVFVRRLLQNMRLQSDPTVIYGLGSRFDGDLRAADLDETTPYNTYRINGLPPTPIALAGLDSIRASLRPTDSGYLYFVGTNDGNHYFSETLDEHNAAVNCYQRNPEAANCALQPN